MADRHFDIIYSFVEDYDLTCDLSEKTILDIGVWTAGTSLLLAPMGAEVYAIEEVMQYSEMVNYITRAFGSEEKQRYYSLSLYEFLPMYADTFDYIIYSGIIYHVSDPLLSLQHVFNSVKDGRTEFLETYGVNEKGSISL